MERKMNNDRFWMKVFAAITLAWLVLIMLICIALFQVITAHAEPNVIMDGEYILAEIHTQEDAVEIQEGPPINRISEDLDEQDANGHQMEYLGEFRLTYYCPCAKCNGNNKAIDRQGNPLVWGTVAVDPKVIPLGTKLVIDGYDAVFTARDTGGKWVQGNHIDIFVPVPHSEALAMCTDERVKVWKWTDN